MSNTQAHTPHTQTQTHEHTHTHKHTNPNTHPHTPTNIHHNTITFAHYLCLLPTLNPPRPRHLVAPKQEQLRRWRPVPGGEAPDVTAALVYATCWFPQTLQCPTRHRSSTTALGWQASPMLLHEQKTKPEASRPTHTPPLHKPICSKKNEPTSWVSQTRNINVLRLGNIRSMNAHIQMLLLMYGTCVSLAKISA